MWLKTTKVRVQIPPDVPKKERGNKMYKGNGAIIYIHWECDSCGASGDTSVDGDEYVNDMYSVTNFYCEVCGEEIEHDD